MRAGRLRDNVSIESIGSARDQFGQVVESWSEETTRRCSIEPINGREYFAAQGENVIDNVRIRFRYEAGLISEKKRLVDKSVSPNVVYDIQSIINPGNEDRELICMCVRRGVV